MGKGIAVVTRRWMFMIRKEANIGRQPYKIKESAIDIRYVIYEKIFLFRDCAFDVFQVCQRETIQQVKATK